MPRPVFIHACVGPGRGIPTIVRRSGILGFDGKGLVNPTSPRNASPLQDCSLALAIDPVTPAVLYAGTRGGGVFAIRQTAKLIYLPLLVRE